MSCRVSEDNDLFAKYLNGQLDPAALDQLELHILECPACLEEVELLQAMREEVAARAPEIRSFPGSTRRLRWSWVAAAALVVLISGVVIQRSLLHQKAGPVIARQAPPQQGVVAPRVSERPGTGPPESSSKALEESPRQGNGTSETHGSSVPKQSAPSPVDRNPSHQVASPPPSLATPSNKPPATNPELAVRAPDTEVTTSHPAEKPSAAQTSMQAKVSPSGLMSDEGERELFRLSAVHPAPYDFSGVSSRPGFAGIPNPAGARPGGRQSPGERRALFTSAMRAYVDRNYDEAADQLQQFLKTEPNTADANFYLGVTWLLKGRPDQAFEPLKTAAANEHTRWAQPAHFYLAKAYLETRDLASAEAELAAAAAMTGTLTASARSDLAALQALRSREQR